MQVTNPLVPPPTGQPGGGAAPVANAPSTPDATPRETARPVTASRESERSQTEDRPSAPPPESDRGGNLDIQV